MTLTPHRFASELLPDSPFGINTALRPGAPDLEPYERLVEACRERGILLFGCLGYAPEFHDPRTVAGAEEYARCLALAGKAIHEASPKAKVLGLNMAFCDVLWAGAGTRIWDVAGLVSGRASACVLDPGTLRVSIGIMQSSPRIRDAQDY